MTTPAKSCSKRCARVLSPDHPITLRLAQALNSLNQHDCSSCHKRNRRIVWMSNGTIKQVSQQVQLTHEPLLEE